MLTMQTILNQLMDGEIYDALIEMMQKIEDFSDARQQCENALTVLRAELRDDTTPSVGDVMKAIRQQTVSNLLFSGFLGIKANLDNFINPIARNFMDVDPETYLREDIAQRLPDYEQASRVLTQFRDLLSFDQQAMYEDITSYSSILETVVPKLAHYCGYLLGNELLPRVILGYLPDMALTAQYRMMMRDYFGRQINIE